MDMQRALWAAVLLLMLVAPVCARAANEPAILRTDAFVAMRYDAQTALVFFSNGSLPANSGAPAGAWPQDASKWVGAHTRLQLVRSGTEKEWAKRWPGGADFAPHMGAEFTLALGGPVITHGRLSSIGYLPLCDTTWLVGLVSVDAADRGAYDGLHAEGFVAYVTPAEAVPVLNSNSGGRAIGPVLLSSDADAFDATARTKIEGQLTGRVTGDYANYLAAREAAYEKGKPTALVHVEGEPEMIAGHARMSYSAQKMMVAPAMSRYYVRAVWRSGDSAKGRELYTISAWFTPDWEMESVTDSEVPLDAAAEDNARVLSILPLDALPMLDQHDEEAARYSVLLMEERGPEGALYSLKRWTEGGLLPTGIYFANRCK